jgi:hypothetical protein
MAVSDMTEDARRAWMPPALWFIGGGLVAFSLLASLGVGFLILLPSVGFLVLIFSLRIPDGWVVLAGAGITGAVLWGTHIASPDTPDDDVWLVVAFAALALVGLVMSLRVRRPGSGGGWKISTRGQMTGLIAAVLVAVSILWLAEDVGGTWRLGFGFIGAGPDWDGWPVLSVTVVIGSWVNVGAWAARVWPVAIICSLLTFAAPWGFIYPGILTGPILAIAAGFAWARASR